MTKPKYDLEDLAIFATYDGVDAHTNFVAEVADSALDVIRGYEHEVERLQARERELEAALRALVTVSTTPDNRQWPGQWNDAWHAARAALAAVEKRPTKGDQEWIDRANASRWLAAVSAEKEAGGE